MVALVLAVVAVDVAPLVGAWIEILILVLTYTDISVAPLVGAWIEIILMFGVRFATHSRSSRGSVD